ncbi:MAG: c-type cytochrome, partial [Actinomycetota bacterium]|nr:c-type cytochrome [Actinomycetota bacterium]
MRRPGAFLFPVVAALGVAVASCLAGVSRPAAAQPPPVPAPSLYLSDCAWCHGNAGEGTERAPALIGVGAASAHFYLSTGRMPIEDPAAPVRRAEPVYDDEAIAELVAYIAALGPGPVIPEVDGGEVAAGLELYTAHCAACHSSSGIGAALSSGVVAPDLFRSSRVETGEAIRIGPGNMPVFGPQTLDEKQLKDIVAYV